MIESADFSSRSTELRSHFNRGESETSFLLGICAGSSSFRNKYLSGKNSISGSSRFAQLIGEGCCNLLQIATGLLSVSHLRVFWRTSYLK